MNTKKKLPENISERNSKILKLSMDQDLVSSIDFAKRNIILRLFIGLVQNKYSYNVQACSEEDCLALLNWLSSEKININKPNWHKTDDGKLIIPQLWLDRSSENYNLSCWALDLCYMLPILIKCKGDIYFTDEKGRSILHVFLEDHLRNCEMTMPGERDYEMVKYLIDKGISVEAADKYGNTPLFIAAYRMETGFLELFLQNCVNVNACNEQGDTLLHILLNNSDPKIIAFNMEYRVILVQLLLAKGADVNLKNNVGWTPVHTAVKRKTPLLKNLVEAGADVNAKDIDGLTPLHLAALSGNFYAAEYLIKKGADLSHRESTFGFTVLHMAALHCDRQNFKFLLWHTLDVNDGGNYGITALHLASFQGNVLFVQMLIAHGANVYCQDNMMHSTALHFVAKEGDILDYISYIGDVQSKPNWKPYLLNEDHPKHLVALLLQNGLDINAKDVRGRTPLHLLTDFTEPPEYETTTFCPGSDDCYAKTLLSFGAYVDVQDIEGNTPLHNALKTDYERAVSSLIEFGADINDADTSRIVLSCDETMVRDEVLVHVIKLKVADLPVSDAYSPFLDDPGFRNHYRECLAKVNVIKDFSIDADTSIYDFLHMNWKRRLDFAQQIPVNLEKNFWFYSKIIKGSCREAQQRKLLMEPAKLAWYQITKIYLPDICVERILDYLKNRYLRVLVDGASSICN